MSDGMFDAMRACGEYPRKGYGFQDEDRKRAEIIKNLSENRREPWIIREARRMKIEVPD